MHLKAHEILAFAQWLRTHVTNDHFDQQVWLNHGSIEGGDHRLVLDRDGLNSVGIEGKPMSFVCQANACNAGWWALYCVMTNAHPMEPHAQFHDHMVETLWLDDESSGILIWPDNFDSAMFAARRPVRPMTVDEAITIWENIAHDRNPIRGVRT